MGLHFWEILLILIAVLLLFGGKKLPGLARSLGSSLSEFKKGMREGEKGLADADGAGAKKTDSPESKSAPEQPKA
jgi:sec-independent protein translocase protein TatA